MKDYYNIKEIAEATLVHPLEVWRRARKESWPFIFGEMRGKGGRPPKLFAFRSLPSDIELALMEMEKKMEKLPATLPPPETLSADSHLSGEQPNVSPKQRELDGLRREFVRRIEAFASGTPRKKTDGLKRGILLYNTGELWPELYQVLGKASPAKYYRWKGKVETSDDPFPLADRRGMARRGERSVTDEQARILLACYLHSHKPSMASAINLARDIMKYRGIEDPHCDGTYRNFLNEFEKFRYDQVVFCREGEGALWSKCLPYLERDPESIQVGDLFMFDAKTSDVVIKDPWRGRERRMSFVFCVDFASNFIPGWVLASTETSLAYLATYRSGTLKVGKYPRVCAFDNAKAACARDNVGGCLDEKIIIGAIARHSEVSFVKKYHGQSKINERVGGIIAQAERWLPTFCGISPQDKPAWQRMGEPDHKALHQKQTGGRPLEFEEAWAFYGGKVYEYNRTPQRGHLGGRSPLEIFESGRGPGIDEEELRLLLMAERNRKIHRNGVSLFGKNFYHPALYGRSHKVTVRFNPGDLSSVLIYDELDNFLCQAARVPKIHALAERLGDEADQALFKEQLNLQMGLRKRTIGPMRRFSREDVIPAIRSQLEANGILELPAAQESPQEVLDPEEVRRKVEELESLGLPAIDEYWIGIAKLADPERYERIIEAEAQGMELPESEKTFARFFEQGEYFDTHRGYFERRKLAMEEAFGRERQEVTA